MLAGARAGPRRGEVREIGDRRRRSPPPSPRPGPATRWWSPARATRPARRSPDVMLPFDDAEELRPRSRPPSCGRHWREAERGNPEPGPGAPVIALTLAEVAAVTGGRLHRATGTERVTGGRVRLPHGRPGRAVRRPARRAGRRARLRRGRGRGRRGRGARHARSTRPRCSCPLRTRALATGSYLGAPTRTARAPRSSPRWPAWPRTVAVLSGPPAGSPSSGSPAPPARPPRRTCSAAVLAPLGPTVAPPGSFNNELGLP